MNAAEQINPVIDRLGRVLDSGNLPPPYDRCGARLLALLTRPVQVVVTGFEDSGKSTLIEMMAVQPGLGQPKAIPVFELAYGETEQALIERADGSVSSIAGLLKDCICPDDAVRARQELPNTRLIQQDFVEIGLHGDLTQKRTTLDAAIARADLMIWCSQEFSEEEQQLWSMVPDHIKDHSVLALTMADQQLMRGVLNNHISRLEPIVANEFLGLFPVATIQGITAQTRAETVNQELWSSSGGKSLMELISRQIRQGRTADIDQARIFMDRLATKMPQTSPKSEAADVVAPVASQPSPPAKSTAIDETNIDTANDDKAVAALSQAVDLLQHHAARMLDEVEAADGLDTEMILNGCSEAINSVSSLLGTTEPGDPTTEALQNDVQEGEEMLMLFQLERGADAALDAVTLVLQLRKELVDKLAT
ncbi:MAG: hypothetical protein AAFW87_03335 [Pseudomonadota bacterium]